MSWKEFYHNRWTRFIFWAVLYLLWVIWLGNFWWLLGIAVIFDHNITKKVNWLFWRKEYKEGEKPSFLLDWLDAIIFAVVVVTFINTFFFQAFKIPSSSMESSLYTGDHLFVSKLTYGPKVPQTPLTIPFTHNVIFGKESYSTVIQNDYRRLKGFRDVEKGDCVVFGFPHGDTVLRAAPSEDYYTLCRLIGREATQNRFGPVVVRPVDKKDHYVKRCVAVAGDTLEIRNGQVFVNGQKQEEIAGLQMTYKVVTNGQRINNKLIDKLGLNTAELYYDPSLPGYPAMALTAQMLESLQEVSGVVSIEPCLDSYPPDYPDSYVSLFPYVETGWTRDNYGPIWMPSKGATVELNEKNLALYERVIRVYENNELSVTADGRIIINGQEVSSYTFKQDYYFMMGDNRHNSLDSRYWGFVPEDHIVGKPVVVWLSTDRNREFPKSIRWDRFMKFVCK